MFKVILELAKYGINTFSFSFMNLSPRPYLEIWQVLHCSFLFQIITKSTSICVYSIPWQFSLHFS
jgi:hypothetical protein